MLKYLCLISVVALATFTGCKADKSKIYKQAHEGHTYILYRTYYGCAILHDADCVKCRTDRNNHDIIRRTLGKK